MTQTITATFENGVFKPTEPINPPEHTRVRLILDTVDEIEQKKRNQETLAALQEIWQKIRVHSTEPHFTRDQLHERR